MATNNPTPVEASGAYSPQDYSLKTLNFLTSNGKRIELKKIMMEFSYYEDIYYLECEVNKTIDCE